MTVSTAPHATQLKNCIILIRISLLICYVKLIQRCLKNYETATSTLAIDNKNKSKLTGLACGIKLTNPCKACWFHNNFVKLLSVYFMMTMKETKFIRPLIALLLADIPKSYMKVSLLISSCKLLTLTVLRIFH